MPESSEQRRLLDWLHDRFPDSPLKRLKGWFADGRVTLDGKPVNKFHEVCSDPGDRLQLGETVKKTDASGRRGKTTDFKIRDTRLRLVHVDEHLLVADKEAGLLSVPAEGVKAQSALDILRGETRLPIQPVHRLDRFTSGLICFAVGDAARSALIESLRAGEIDRQYIAFVEGTLPERQGTWVNHLELDHRGDQQVAGKPSETSTRAVTHYWIHKPSNAVPLPSFQSSNSHSKPGLNTKFVFRQHPQAFHYSVIEVITQSIWMPMAAHCTSPSTGKLSMPGI